MKLIFTALLICSTFFSTQAQAASVSGVLSLSRQLQSELSQNGHKLSGDSLNEIESLLTRALTEAQSSGDDSTYTRCRQAGYSHDSCNGQGPGYLSCRQAGYAHESCSGQGEGYLRCRQAGYAHDSCKNQTDEYLSCRQAGYAHESCSGQGEGYLRCRQAGYSHDSCKGQ